MLFVFSCSTYAKITFDDPQQSIRFWQQYSISESDNINVGIANGIFNKLTRVWLSDSQLSIPLLTVVRVENGLWAASLEDGNILISESALDFSLSSGTHHNLAFLLAHELAHQSNSDFKKLKYLRLSGNKTEENVNEEEYEFKADKVAITTMAIVGYDPIEVVNGNGFLALWAEKNWHINCGLNWFVNTVCAKARYRTQTSKQQLVDIANNTTIFKIATHALVAGDFDKARAFFMAFQKIYSGYVVLDNIGLTYLLQTLERMQNTHYSPKLVYPIVLNTQTAFNSSRIKKSFRGIQRSENIARFRFTEDLKKADDYFQRSIRLFPKYKTAYQHLIYSKILQGKIISARALLEESYKNQFENDDIYYFLNGLINYSENNISESIVSFQSYYDLVSPNNSQLLYAVSYNLAYIFGLNNNEIAATEIWRKLSVKSQLHRNSLLFRVAIEKINGNSINYSIRSTSNNVGHILSDQKAEYLYTIWINGEPLKIHRTKDKRFFAIDKNQNIEYTWQSFVKMDISIMGVKLGDSYDRPYKKLGLPQRQQITQQGLYINYDDQGIAFKVVDNKIAGWFTY